MLIDDVAEHIAGALRPDDGSRVPAALPDHLERWLEVREAVPWREASGSGEDGPVTPASDGAADSVRTFDCVLDPARGAGPLAALEQVRADAARGAVLDFELLRGWQRHVLGTPELPDLRSLPAFAEKGRERYGVGPDTRARLDACRAESAASGDRPLPLTARAARACLDVCFFHPFDDGNARSAFLTLVFVLAREEISLDRVALLRRVSFRADAPEDGLILARSIDTHLTATRRGAVGHKN